MSKISLEKEEKKGIKLTKEEALEAGRILGPLKRMSPESMEKLEALAATSKKSKIEIVSEALEHYFEMQNLQSVWKTVLTMSPEQLIASWQLFRFLMSLNRSIYTDIGKEFIEGMVSKFTTIIEEARKEGYERARTALEEDLIERSKVRTTQRMSKIIEKIEPLLDVLTDYITDQMLKSMFKGKVPKQFKVPVEVEDSSEKQNLGKQKLPVEVEES